MATTEFVLLLSPEIAKEATQQFFRRTFREYPIRTYLGWTFVGITLLLSNNINSNVYGSAFGVMVLVFVFLRFPMVFVVLPFLAEYGAKRNPELRVNLNSATISISGGRSSPTLPLRKQIKWTEFQAIWEYPAFFILVFNSNNFWCLPIESMPAEVRAMIQEIGASKAERA